MGNTCTKLRFTEILCPDKVVKKSPQDKQQPRSTTTSSLETEEEESAIPDNYEIIRALGSGVYGTVFKCRERGSDVDVAVKTARSGLPDSLKHEAFVCKKLMQYNLDQANIVKYHGELHNKGRLSLKFEALDMSMWHYLKKNNKRRMQLKDIRKVIQQLAVTFSALKKRKVIHTDVKTDNIMLVDHIKEPFKVKLIDFGVAIKVGGKRPPVLQPVPCRAPEVMLWLPFSEAIDIWSLGCVMGEMILGSILFPSVDECQVMQFIVELLGPPPPQMMKGLVMPQTYFIKDGESWLLKKPIKSFVENRRYCARSLSEMKMERLEEDNPWEAEDRSECIELLKAMLQWDPINRITPEGILNHPFITRSYFKEKPEPLPRGLILVQPALSENRIDTAGMGSSTHHAVANAANDSLGKFVHNDSENTENSKHSPSFGDVKCSLISDGPERFTCSDTNDSGNPSRKRKKNKRKKKMKKKCLQHHHAWVRKKLKLFVSKCGNKQRMERDNSDLYKTIHITHWNRTSNSLATPSDQQDPGNPGRNTKKMMKNKCLQHHHAWVRKELKPFVSKRGIKQRVKEDSQLEAWDNNLDPLWNRTGKSHEPLRDQTDPTPELSRDQADSNNLSRSSKKKNRLQRICPWFRKKLICCASNPEV